MKGRALIVTPLYLPLLGGMERQVALLAAELGAMGYEVDVLTEHADRSSPRHEQTEAARVTRVRTTSDRGPLTYPLVVAGMVAFLLRNRRRYRFAVVRTLTLPAVVVGLLKRLRVLPYPTLVTAETGGEHDDVMALRDYPASGALRHLLAQHDVLNGICLDNIVHYRQLGFPEGKLSRIHNGVETDGYAQRHFPERVRVFGFLGRLHREKGLHELLDAFARLEPEARLVIAGEGEEEPALRAFVEQHDLSRRVKFAGRVPYEQLGDFFDGIDCLVLPSYSEGLPLSVLEAAAHKRPVVATDVSDLRELFGENIFLCAKRDPEDLRRVMTEVMAPGALERVDYDAVIERLSIGHVARELEARVLGTAR
ncbi:MAG: teichuronic acid biosynthesis glycosyltransferase TuaC [Thermoleophilaceae bacterium]|jgi:glycosyltransferase involved in cell wall biosynthesis|nr:teichuronic acid biosynthesis glycosyltransferase TuaC [Thermoleophilaceae bacterium]